VEDVAGEGRYPSARQGRDVTRDAVVIVPGLMGSELRDARSGDLLWGLKSRMVGRALGRDGGLQPLHVTEAEREAERPALVRATGLLALPAWLPVLHGTEPYRDLDRTVCRAVADERAVLRFAYDWRLSVAHNGRLLAEAARRHLEAWTATAVGSPELRGLLDGGMPRVVFVAHSMGGLVTRAALAHQADLVPDTRTVITLGTPFLGAAKAAVMLNGGRRAAGAKAAVLDRLQALAVTMPGVHDLLPDYRCVDEGRDVTRLTPNTVEGIGGDPHLAAAAAHFQRAMRAEDLPPLPGHRAVYGTAQPTVQSIRIDSGVVHPQRRAFRSDEHGDLVRDEHGIPVWWNRQGDGTVYRDAANSGASKPVSVPLQHGALAKDPHALAYVLGVLTEHEPHVSPPMAPGQLGLDLPDTGVAAAAPWRLRLTGRNRPVGITCEIRDTETDAVAARPRLSADGEGLAAAVTLPAPGLYRITAHATDKKQVTQLLMAFPPE